MSSNHFKQLTHIRPCGISLGHVEMIHAETCTAFLCLLIELFGTAPEQTSLTGVAIDRGNNESKGNQKHFLIYDLFESN